MPLSDSKLRALRPTGQRVDLPDRDGLALRMGPGGTCTWTVTYTIRGTGGSAGVRVARTTGARQRLTVGSYPAMSLAEARVRAQEVRGLARAGTDPRPAPVEEEEPVVGPFTVADLLDRYVYYPWGALFRLLLLTGSRRNEWAGAKWTWVDLGGPGYDAARDSGG